MLGTSDAWSMSRLSHRPIEPALKIEDCRIFSQFPSSSGQKYVVKIIPNYQLIKDGRWHKFNKNFTNFF